MKKSDSIARLVARSRKGDERAMRQLYQQFSRAMLTTAYRITNNQADAEDIIQDAFVKSFQQLRQLKEPAAYGGWLKRMVVNFSLQKQRTKQHFAPLEQVEIREAEIEGPWYQDIPFTRIQTAIQALPNGSREVLSLYLLEGYKHREIAEWLGISVSTSKSQYRYALRILRETLKLEAKGKR